MVVTRIVWASSIFLVGCALCFGLADLVSSVGAAALPEAQTTDNSVRFYSIVDRGGLSLITDGSDTAATEVTYTRIQPDSGSTTPSGIGIFGFRNADGVLITETSIQASPTLGSGRIFAHFIEGSRNTGIAIANPNDEEVRIDFFFSDLNRDPVDFISGSFTLAANAQTAQFVSEEPFNLESPGRATLTFTTSLPVSVVTLRQLITARGESLFSSMPVADITQTSTDTLFLPHFATGGRWDTDIILINPTDEVITGRLGFISPGIVNPPFTTPGITTLVPLLGVAAQGNVYPYTIGPKGFVVVETLGALDIFVTVGSIRAVPDEGSVAPVGQAIFTFSPIPLGLGFIPVSEAGVSGAETGTAFRTYVEVSGDPGAVGSIRSGVAIHNIAFDPATVTLELTNLDGELLGVAESIVPGSGQRSFFIDEVFPADVFAGPVNGVLRVTAVETIAMVALRGRINERGEFLMTTTRPTNENGATTTDEFLIPHLVHGGGWSTQTILFSGIAGQTGQGTMRFFDTDGQGFDIPLQ